MKKTDNTESLNETEAVVALAEEKKSGVENADITAETSGSQDSGAEKAAIPMFVVLLVALIVGLASGFGVGKVIKGGDYYHAQTPKAAAAESAR
jgi:predicted metalloprotease